MWCFIMYCPDWILSVTCSEAARRYVCFDYPLEGISKYLSNELTEHYKDPTPEKIAEISEEILRFLAEIEEDDVNKVCLSFAYNQIHFLSDRQPRKFKGLFVNAFDEQKEETKNKEALRLFKVFVFYLRSYDDYEMPGGWTFEEEEELEWFGELLRKELSVIDLL